MGSNLYQNSTPATAITGGYEAFAEGIAKADKTSFNLTGQDIKLGPGDTLTISIVPNAANPDVNAAINWVDKF